MSTEPSANSESSSPPDTPVRRTLRRRLARLGVIIAVGYLILCGLLVALETRLVFPGAYFDASPFFDPNRFTPDQPITGTVVGLDYTAEDGATVTGRMLVRENPRRTILFLHGNGIQAIDMDGWTRRLSDAMEATVLTAEFRGFQDDEFTPSESSVTADALAAMDALSTASGVPAHEIVVYGRSLGGGVAAGLVRKMIDRGDPPRSLILDRTFDSVVAVGQSQFWFVPVRLLLRNQFRSDIHLRDYQGNVVQIHGRPDQIVPMRFGRALFESLTTSKKRWIEVPDMKHNDRLPLDALLDADAQLRELESAEES